MPAWHLLHFKNYPIFEQLQLEEALLRADEGNWCLINEGSPKAIVMGISGNLQQLVDTDMLLKKPVPIIRRFSGGGTVFVDEHTLFITFIGNCDQLQVPPCPQKVLQWTENLYCPLFEGLNFQVKENDYVLGNRKFGGSAQYMRKQRWLHHSSLLWYYNPENMSYLTMPSRRPHYRKDRHHTDFLCRLSDYLPDRSQFTLKMIDEFKKQWNVTEIDLLQLKEILERPHRKSTTYI